MALDRIHLRKLLKLLSLDARQRQSALRVEIRNDIDRDTGKKSSGGDFYAPFWSDATRHVFDSGDLRTMVDERIAANRRRRNLYPLLRDGFLLWWNERRRWTNRPFQLGRHLKAHFPFPGLTATVKVESILLVRDGLNAEHAVYPYFAPELILSDEAARLGLWLLIQALPSIPQGEIRILDVIRGQTFSIDRHPLRGDEEAVFRRRYIQLLEAYAALRDAI